MIKWEEGREGGRVHAHASTSAKGALGDGRKRMHKTTVFYLIHHLLSTFSFVLVDCGFCFFSFPADLRENLSALVFGVLVEIVLVLLWV